MGVIRELITRLGFKIDDAEARRYHRRLINMGKQIRSFGRSMSLWVTAPIVGLGTAMIKTAADAEETENKFREVFKGIDDAADAATKSLTDDFDLANTTAQELLSTTGDLLVGFGFTRRAALDLSKEVNELAVDVASFKNVQGGAEQASRAITRALLGEREMLKGMGIAILEADVKAKVMQLRQEGLTFETERQAKAFATLRLIMDRSKDAIGDYARTQDSVTNRARKLRQQFLDVSVALGKDLLPVVTDLFQMLSSVLEWFRSFSPQTRKIIIGIAAITAAIGPLTTALGVVMGLLTSIVGMWVLLPALVGALAFLIGEDIASFIKGDKSMIGVLLKAIKLLALQIPGLLSSMWASIKQDAKEIIDGLGEYAKDAFKSIAPQWLIDLIEADKQKRAAESYARAQESLKRMSSMLSSSIDASSINALRLNPSPELRALMFEERLRSGGSITENINVGDININVPPGTPLSELGGFSHQDFTESLLGAKARATTSNRIGP